ncbi:aspartate aminotransferase family protein [Emcibacter sp.]|uniref:aspartate aminotransferase family protein n=1 Tax=Emcibacter sp. TaxID=1979954 RepID=UPI003A8D85DD
MYNYNPDHSTEEWQQLDQAHHVHPFTDPSVLGKEGVRVIVKAEGSHVWDSEGNRILDSMAGLWCVNVGYGRKELVEAATRQLEILPFYNSFFHTATPQQIELAELLSELTPEGINHFFFANSGSEANDTVVRLVRHYWEVEGCPEKEIFIGRNLAYHGSTLAATSLGGMAPMHNLGKSLLPGFEHIMQPHWYMLGEDLTPEEFGIKAARALEDKILELGPEKVAAFIGEPVQGAGGVIDPPSTYWPEIQRICQKYNILLVADEVICGFGRTGKWFGSDYYDIKPDLMPMAKGLSSGYLPISALGMSDKVFEVLSRGGQFAHGYTYSGHPVSCAVAIANIRLMQEEGLVERVEKDLAPYFRKSLAELGTHPIVGEIRGVGLLAAVQLVRNPETKELFAAEEAPAIKARDYCLDNNLIMRAVGTSLVASPPLVITPTEIDEMMEKTWTSLDRTAQDFNLL